MQRRDGTALVSFNMLSVIRGVLNRRDHEEPEVSIYYICDEIARTYRGLDLVLNASDWSMPTPT